MACGGHAAFLGSDRPHFMLFMILVGLHGSPLLSIILAPWRFWDQIVCFSWMQSDIFLKIRKMKVIARDSIAFFYWDGIWWNRIDACQLHRAIWLAPTLGTFQFAFVLLGGVLAFGGWGLRTDSSSQKTNAFEFFQLNGCHLNFVHCFTQFHQFDYSLIEL